MFAQGQFLLEKKKKKKIVQFLMNLRWRIEFRLYKIVIPLETC